MSRNHLPPADARRPRPAVDVGLGDPTTHPGHFGAKASQGTRVSEGVDAAPGHIRAYDVRTGQIVWTFRTIPQPGEYGYETWPPDAWQRIGGANSWAGMSLDETRGIVYIPTGSAAFGDAYVAFALPD